MNLAKKLSEDSFKLSPYVHFFSRQNGTITFYHFDSKYGRCDIAIEASSAMQIIAFSSLKACSFDSIL